MAFEILITILTIEKLNSWQSLWPKQLRVTLDTQRLTSWNGFLMQPMETYRLLLAYTDLREAPPKNKPFIFGHFPTCNLTPPIAQIRALCGTNILPKMRKFFKQQFWLWEWIFWQWLMSKMILRWYSDGNQGKYWWNWWKLSGSVMVYIHWTPRCLAKSRPAKELFAASWI